MHRKCRLTSRLGKSRSFLIKRVNQNVQKRRFRWPQAIKGVLIHSLHNYIQPPLPSSLTSPWSVIVVTCHVTVGLRTASRASLHQRRVCAAPALRGLLSSLQCRGCTSPHVRFKGCLFRVWSIEPSQRSASRCGACFVSVGFSRPSCFPRQRGVHQVGVT